jgi:hypothetical protein
LLVAEKLIELSKNDNIKRVGKENKTKYLEDDESLDTYIEKLKYN